MTKTRPGRGKMNLSSTLAIALSLAASASADVISLTDDNWAEVTAGKTVFVKFFAPWCGHCKAMAPDWEKLADEWEDNDVGLIAEVDCTTEETEEICEENDVEGFPTLKFGDPTALEDYEGGRDYDSLSAFAKVNIKAVCSPANIDACDEEKKALIERFQSMPAEELDAAIEMVETKIEEADNDKDAQVEKLQETYERLMEEHDATVRKLKKDHDFGLMRSVKASKGAKTAEEEL